MALALGVIVCDPARLDDALRLLGAAHGEAALFLMHEAVRAAGDARLVALADAGIEVSLCAMDAEARGVDEREGGPRFGSQVDHALLVRDAGRVVAWTGASADPDDWRPGTPDASLRRARVRITVGPDDPRAAQALRAALAYSSLGIDARVWLDGAGGRLLAEPPPERLGARSLAALVASGRVSAEAGPRPDVELTW